MEKCCEGDKTQVCKFVAFISKILPIFIAPRIRTDDSIHLAQAGQQSRTCDKSISQSFNAVWVRPRGKNCAACGEAGIVFQVEGIHDCSSVSACLVGARGEELVIAAVMPGKLQSPDDVSVLCNVTKH